MAIKPTPVPSFTTLPSIAPKSGAVGSTFTASNGVATNTTSYSRRWLLSGVSIGTGTKVVPTKAGSLVLEVTAKGAGGSKIAKSAAVAIASAPVPAPVFTTQPSISPKSGVAGTTFTASNGVATNASGYSRRWLLSGVSIGTGTSVVPASAGSLVLEVTATGAGGSKIAKSAAVTVSPVQTLKPGVLSIGDVTRNEGTFGTSYFDLTVTRPTDSTGPAGATWTRVLDGTADAADFVANSPSSGTVSFASGQFAATIRIEVQGDSLVEPDETFSVELSAPTNGATLGVARATVTITDDDSPAKLIADTFSHFGSISYILKDPRPFRLYPDDSYKVLGPVEILKMTPGSAQASGTYVEGGTFTRAWVHGAQVNPGNRSWAAGGLAANNRGNAAQGLNGVPSVTGYKGTTYSHAANQDPDATGRPLQVDSGTVMKFVSRADGAFPKPYQAVRPGGTDMAILTVVDDFGPDNALRPGVATADNTHHFTTDDWDLSVFNDFPKVAGAPSASQAIANVQRAFGLQFTDSVNSENAHAGKNHPSYGREIAEAVYTTALALHLDYTPAEKIAMLNGLYGIAIDAHERAVEGGDCQIPNGGGNQWKKATLCIVRAALRNASATAKLAEIAAICDAQQYFGFAEDKQVREVTPQVICTPREYLLNRALDPYYPWMEGAYDFTSGGNQIPSGGTNWDAPYRQEFCSRWIGGVIAVMLTKGAQALWNRPAVFEYCRTYYANELALGLTNAPWAGNNIPTFFAKMLTAYWPADPVPPVVTTAKIDGDTMWLAFDKNLDEHAVVAPGDYTVRVNGVPVGGLARAPAPPGPHTTGAGWVRNGIFRDRVGLALPKPVASTDAVTVSYAGGAGANKLRSAVDNVNVAAFTNQAVANVTASFGGVNASYPIVRFTGTNPDRLRPAIPVTIGAASSPRFTLWMPHIKLLAAPTGTVELFGYGGSSPIFEVQILASRAVKIIVRNSAGNMISQMTTATMALNTAYSVRVDCDVSDPSSTSGWNSYLNGASAKGSTNGWPGTASTTIAWAINPMQYYLGGTGLPFFDGEFGGLWLMTGVRVTNPAQVARFTSLTGGSLDIGTDGSGITGSPPEFFFIGDAAQYNDIAGLNRGAGPKFFPQPGCAISDVSGSAWR